MQVNHQPHQYIINPASRTPPYTVLTFDGKNYRVLTKQHHGFLQMSKIWSVFWFLFTSFMLGTALILLFQQKISFILTISIGCLCIFSIFAFYKRNQINQSIFYSSFNLLVWMIPVTVLAFLQIKQLIIPLCFYMLIQSLISIKFMTNKSQILGKVLIIIEALIIVLKVDDKLKNSWKDVIFIHVVFFLFLSLCIIFMTVYLAYMKLKKNSDNLFKHKFPGALMIYFNTIAFCLLTAIPLLNFILEIQFWIICFSLSLVYGFLGSYIYFYRKDIVVFFCTLNEIKAFDQIISFQPIEGIKESKTQFFNSQKKKKHQQIYLYRLSQNWLSKDPPKSEQAVQENPQEESEEQKQEDTKMTDCTICLDGPGQVVWMPCGHLTVCLQCCSSMFDKKNFNCVLCKKTPQQIFIIDTKEKDKKEAIIQERSLEISIQKDDTTIISGSIVLGSENKILNRQKVNRKHKQQKRQKQDFYSKSDDNKLAFLVREGYNVKII